jgi:mono/diheme cytochrome c family protein
MKYSAIVLVFCCLICLASIDPERPKAGFALFQKHCRMCHNLDKTLMGPPLRGITDRRTPSWLFNFISDGDGLRKRGDTIAKRLYNTYNQMGHPSQNLSPKEVKHLIVYLKNPS